MASSGANSREIAQEQSHDVVVDNSQEPTVGVTTATDHVSTAGPTPPRGFFLSKRYTINVEYSEEQLTLLYSQMGAFESAVVENCLNDFLHLFLTSWMRLFPEADAAATVEQQKTIIQLLVMRAETLWGGRYPPGVTSVHEVMTLLDCLHEMIARIFA